MAFLVLHKGNLQGNSFPVASLPAYAFHLFVNLVSPRLPGGEGTAIAHEPLEAPVHRRVQGPESPEGDQVKGRRGRLLDLALEYRHVTESENCLAALEKGASLAHPLDQGYRGFGKGDGEGDAGQARPRADVGHDGKEIGRSCAGRSRALFRRGRKPIRDEAPGREAVQNMAHDNVATGIGAYQVECRVEQLELVHVTPEKGRDGINPAYGDAKIRVCRRKAEGGEPFGQESVRRQSPGSPRARRSFRAHAYFRPFRSSAKGL